MLPRRRSGSARPRRPGPRARRLREELPASPYRGNPDMDVTGLLLAHPTSIVHIFETKCPNAAGPGRQSCLRDAVPCCAAA